MTVDANVAGTVYAILPNGGVFKTVNDGGTWGPLTVPNLDVGVNPAIELAITNTQIVYAGLDNKFGTATGGGFLKSVNGGTTWADSSSGLVTPDSRQVNSIAVQTDPNILLIATDDGIYKSINGGASWSLSLAVNDALPAPPPFSGVRFDPTNGSIAWAAANHVDPDGILRASSGVYKTTNGGTNWTRCLRASARCRFAPKRMDAWPLC